MAKATSEPRFYQTDSHGLNTKASAKRRKMRRGGSLRVNLIALMYAQTRESRSYGEDLLKRLEIGPSQPIVAHWD